MADGSVIIDTELDQSGLKTGLASMAGTVTSGIAKAVEVAGAALVGLGSYAIQVGSDFEAAMSNVAAISGATGSEIEALTEKAKEMGAKTKFSASEAADAFSYMAMAGWKTQDMMEGIEGIMNLATASGADLATTSDIVTDALTALGMSAADSGHFADVLAAASANANTNVELMGETFKYCASMAGSLGYSSEDLALAIGLMANSGLKGSMAGTSLNMIMTRLSTNVNGARDAVEKLGISFYNADGSARPLGEVMDELRVKTANMTAEEKSNFANKVAGTSAQKGLLAILNASQEDYDKLALAIANCTDAETGYSAAAEMAAKMMDNLKGDLTILKSATEGFGIALYDAMNAADEGVGPLRELTQAATALVNELTDAVNENGLAGFASAVGRVLSEAIAKISEYLPMFVKGAIELLQAFIDGLVSSAPSIANIAVELGSTLLNGFLTITSQLFQLGAEIIIAIAESVGQNMPQLVDSFTNGISTLANTIVEYLPQMIEAGAGLLVSLAQGVASAAPTLIEVGVNALFTMIDGLLANAGSFIDCAIQIVQAVAAAIPTIIQGLVERLPEIIQTIVQYLLELRPQITQCWITLFQSIVEALPQIISDIAAALPQIIDSIVERLTSARDRVSETGKTILSSLTDKLAEAIQHISGRLPEIINAITSTLSELIPNIIHTGAELLRSLADGFTEALPGLLDSAAKILSEVISKILEHAADFFECASELVSHVIGRIPELIAKLCDALPTLIDGIVAGIHNLFPVLVQCGVELFTSLVEALPQIISNILSVLPSLITAVVGGLLSMLPTLVDCGVTLFTSLVQALPQIIYNITKVLPEIIAAIIETLAGLIPKIIECGIELLTSLVAALPQIIGSIVAAIPSIIMSIVAALLEGIPNIIHAGIDLLTSLIRSLPDIITTIISAIPTIIESIVTAFTSNIDVIAESGLQLLSSLVTSLPDIILNVVSVVPEIISALVETTMSFFGDIADAGANLMMGLATGIGDSIGNVVSSAIDACGSVLDSVLGFFGIRSPSRLFRDMVGKNLMLGLAKGIDDGTDYAVDSLEKASEELSDVDFDGLADQMRGQVDITRKMTGNEMAGSNAISSYGVAENDETTDTTEGGPVVVQGDVYIDKNKVGRVLAPVINKQIVWDGKK